MASGYIINGKWIPEQETLPQALSIDSVCGAALANANVTISNTMEELAVSVDTPTTEV